MEAGIAWPGVRDNLTSMESWRRADVPMLPGSGPAPRLYDTATGDLVLAATGPVATLYACGITPYDATHMGHAATYTAWDLLVRAWLDAAPETPEGQQPPARYTVVYVQNVTDVDDPLLERADRIKSLSHHEYEFQDKADLMRFLRPYFRSVTVFETIYPDRHNLYFWASQGVLPFAPDWPGVLHQWGEREP